ncbi:MAG TPA: hypothetical protein VFN67_37860 [Polyangiales bacterium]|jgi:hypothetical protein|nr:hypothetical protein [Polyangiales bacterium]
MRKHKTHKRQRGVALTEALIALCMLVVLFAGVVFFHRMYGAKTATLQQARMQAWSATRFDCKGASAGGDVAMNVAIPMPIRVTRAADQRTIRSGAELVCNLDPEQRDDVIGVLSWAIGTSTQGIATDSLATIGGEMLDTIWQSVKDAIPFL